MFVNGVIIIDSIDMSIDEVFIELMNYVRSVGFVK